GLPILGDDRDAFAIRGRGKGENILPADDRRRGGIAWELPEIAVLGEIDPMRLRCIKRDGLERRQTDVGRGIRRATEAAGGIELGAWADPDRHCCLVNLVAGGAEHEQDQQEHADHAAASLPDRARLPVLSLTLYRVHPYALSPVDQPGVMSASTGASV